MASQFGNPLLCLSPVLLVRIRRHENQEHQPILRFIPNAVLDIRGRYYDLIRAQIAFLVADVKPAGAFNHYVNLICAPMRVTLLFLARLETIDVGEHPFGFEQIRLLHLVRRKSPLEF